MLYELILLTALAVPGDRAGQGSQAPEELAVGAMHEIMTAQAVLKQTSPAVGYACSLGQLVEAGMLLDVWLAGKRVDSYRFEVWCDTKGTPQATYRAAAVPLKKARGTTLTFCTDETNVPRMIDGDAAACLAKGAPLE
jgi:hypothetical protein